MAGTGLNDVRDAYPASGDLSANQWHFVNLDSSDELQVAGAGEAAAVLVDKPDAQGEIGTVVLMGITKVVAAGAIDAWTQVTPDSSGEAVAATAATVDTTTSTASQDVAGDQVAAVALEDASSGDIFSVFVVGPMGGLV